MAFVPIGGTYTMDPSEAAGLVRVMTPRLAVPMHYGFVVGEPSDAERSPQKPPRSRCGRSTRRSVRAIDRGGTDAAGIGSRTS